MDNVDFIVKLQCLMEELCGIVLNLTFSTDDTHYRKKKSEPEHALFALPWYRTFTMATNFSVGVPEITEDQFFEDFSCISQIQAKKRGQINKEVLLRYGL